MISIKTSTTTTKDNVMLHTLNDWQSSPVVAVVLVVVVFGIAIASGDNDDDDDDDEPVERVCGGGVINC